MVSRPVSTNQGGLDLDGPGLRVPARLSAARDLLCATRTQTQTHHLVPSRLVDCADLHDGVSPGENLCGLHEHVVLVAGNYEETGQLFHRLSEGTLVDQSFRRRSALDRPCLAAVAEPSATDHGATTCLEELAELVVGVEGGLMVGRGAGLPLGLVVGGEHDDVFGHELPFSDDLTPGVTSARSYFDARARKP